MIKNYYLLLVACCLFPLASFANNDRVFASSTQCQEIRRSRRIAIAEGLDDRNLAILEERYCGRPHSPQTQSSTCSDLTIMAGLARIAPGDNVLAQMVASEEQILCSQYASNRRSGIWQYANGQVVKSGSLWHYPNGQYARTGRDWRYPNGEYASFGLVWKYPNGVNAKFGSNWYKPNGDRVDRDILISWGCTYVSRYDCDRLLRGMNSRNSDQFYVALLELAWQAHQSQR